MQQNFCEVPQLERNSESPQISQWCFPDWKIGIITVNHVKFFPQCLQTLMELITVKPLTADRRPNWNRLL
jgi:hypothetical protein